MIHKWDNCICWNHFFLLPLCCELRLIAFSHIKMCTLSNVAPQRAESTPLHVGFNANVSPENSPDGVSVRYAHAPGKQWYVMRATYHREKKAYDYLVSKNIECYLPLRRVVKMVNGRRRFVLEPFLPNFLFVYTTLEVIKSFSKDSNLFFLNHYYNHFKTDEFGKNPPLTVDDASMQNFIRVTSIDNEHVKLVKPENCHYKSGDMVRIIEGQFKGVMGRVARISGQQRVVVEVKDVCLVSTAYIPSAFLEVVKE